MIARRPSPPQPLAPHGIPGHLVEFVEALRGQGVSVGPSETVDAGRVLTVLGLSDREVLREGLACAMLRRPDHRDTYDAMFDLWFPAALGARAVTADPETSGAAPAPGEVEALRAMLVDLLTANPELADTDQRLVAMIAQIVEAYGRYRASCESWSTRRPDVAPPNSWAASTSRRTASRSFPKTLNSCAPPVNNCARCVAWWHHWPAPWPPGWRHGADGRGPGRSTCARPCASRCPPAGCRSTWCCANPARPVPSWWCSAMCPARSLGSATSPCY